MQGLRLTFCALVILTVLFSVFCARGEYLYWQLDSGAFEMARPGQTFGRRLPWGVSSTWSSAGALSKAVVLGRLSAGDRWAYIEFANYDAALHLPKLNDVRSVPYRKLTPDSYVATGLVPTGLSAIWHRTGSAIPEPTGASLVLLGSALALLRRRNVDGLTWRK